MVLVRADPPRRRSHASIVRSSRAIHEKGNSWLDVRPYWAVVDEPAMAFQLRDQQPHHVQIGNDVMARGNRDSGWQCAPKKSATQCFSFIRVETLSMTIRHIDRQRTRPPLVKSRHSVPKPRKAGRNDPQGLDVWWR